MNRLFCFAGIALVLFVQTSTCEKLEPQIKPITQEVQSINPEYVNVPTYQITKKNETYNNRGLKWEIRKDWPADTDLLTEVYVTDSNWKNANLILRDITPFCQESKNRHLLPKFIVVDESVLGGQCIKKRNVNVKDMGQFRFEVLIPNVSELGKYYKVDYTVRSSVGTIIKVTFYSKWGYLQD